MSEENNIEEETEDELDNRDSVAQTKSISFPVLLIGVLSLAAFVVSAVVYVRLNTFIKEQSVTQELQNQLQDLTSTINKISQVNQQQQHMVDNMEGKLDTFSRSITLLSGKQESNSSDLLLGEVEYLLQIAVYRLTLEKDVSTALVAMQSADRRLKDIVDTGILEVRKQLTADINALQSINIVDISGLALYLADIANRTEDLPLKRVKHVETGATTPREVLEDDVSTIPVWRRLLNKVWQEIKGLVVISRESEHATLSLLPEQRYYLYQNLRLQFEMARLSVLRRETAHLRASIDIINNWLQRYYDTSDTAVSSIMISLGRMAELELDPSLPDISSSLEVLRALIQKPVLEIPDS